MGHLKPVGVNQSVYSEHMRFNKGSRSTVISLIERQTDRHAHIHIYTYIHKYR